MSLQLIDLKPHLHGQNLHISKRTHDKYIYIYILARSKVNLHYDHIMFMSGGSKLNYMINITYFK